MLLDANNEYGCLLADLNNGLLQLSDRTYNNFTSDRQKPGTITKKMMKKHNDMVTTLLIFLLFVYKILLEKILKET